ncbi:hypothetical protein B5G06_10770 [Flavonifractor sp. An52]|uniref:hypothetical protein n=1 Tax=Flavonifractor sp. An52 TaxID=1965642 RepID=UPI000B3A6155|nr:hypothetical protein [Flavonifractor sp. An52]OUN81344.1 hypothetical protein B5G06_10770 [Flavonifractor sp. An52]
MIFFTSDLHLGHENCIRLCNRPFSSIEEMDETLIENWNRKITGKDTVYILGDLIGIVKKTAHPTCPVMPPAFVLTATVSA